MSKRIIRAGSPESSAESFYASPRITRASVAHFLEFGAITPIAPITVTDSREWLSDWEDYAGECMIPVRNPFRNVGCECDRSTREHMIGCAYRP